MNNKRTIWRLAIAVAILAVFGLGWFLGSRGTELPATEAYASESASKDDGHGHGENKHGGETRRAR
ncbi:MAG: hypothetical protein M5R36_08375 [Deltaproteobacteria bacterium]|nr:hypothetical protein [Deltaproteobacteria bacterium]